MASLCGMHLPYYGLRTHVKWNHRVPLATGTIYFTSYLYSLHSYWEERFSCCYNKCLIIMMLLHWFRRGWFGFGWNFARCQKIVGEEMTSASSHALLVIHHVRQRALIGLSWAKAKGSLLPLPRLRRLKLRMISVTSKGEHSTPTRTRIGTGREILVIGILGKRVWFESNGRRSHCFKDPKRRRSVMMLTLNEKVGGSWCDPSCMRLISYRRAIQTNPDPDMQRWYHWNIQR